MSLQNSEIRGRLALQSLGRRQRALSVLRKSDGPGRFTVELLLVAGLAGIVCFALERATDRESLVSALAWLVVAIAWVGLQQWKAQRRLEAIIALLELDQEKA